MAAILLHQIVFLFISRFIIDAGSPWARIGPRAPAQYSPNFDEGTPVNDINDVSIGKIGRDMVSAIFKNYRNENLIWTIYPVLIYIESNF